MTFRFVFYYFSLLMMGFSLSLIGKILLIMYIVLSFVTQSGLSVWTVFFMAYIISLSDLEMKLNRDPGVLFGR